MKAVNVIFFLIKKMYASQPNEDHVSSLFSDSHCPQKNYIYFLFIYNPQTRETAKVYIKLITQ